jgi:ketosteroid isomerase-like protein
MKSEENGATARALLAKIGAGASPEAIAALFQDNVTFEIPGDVGAFPWIGRKTGGDAVIEFITGTRTLLQTTRFAVQEVLVSDDRAVIIGELASW